MGNVLYLMLGWMEDLPSLQQSRSMHGCANFLNPDGSKVLLVAGGYSKGISLGSTEFLVLNSSQPWIEMVPLPPPWDAGVHGIVGVTIDNVVLLLGGDTDRIVDRVVQYDSEGQRWVGLESNINMTRARHNHAVSVIDFQQVRDLCLPTTTSTSTSTSTSTNQVKKLEY